MDASLAIHRIFVCMLCRDPVTGARAGEALKTGLAACLSGHDDGLPPIEVHGVACMAGCGRPLIVAFQADRKASYLFGSIDPRADAEALARFARQYCGLADGWCSSTERPEALAGKTLARIPALPRPAGART